MPNKHSAGACDCCDFETDCQSLTLINLAKATGIDGMTLRIALPNEDHNFTLDFDAGIPPGPGNATGNPVGLLSFGSFVIDYVESDSLIASDPPTSFGTGFYNPGAAMSGFPPDPLIGVAIVRQLYNTTVETAGIAGLQRRHEKSIHCSVQFNLKITYDVSLTFKCVDGVPSWVLACSARQPAGVLINPPLFAPPTSGPLWSPFLVLEDYSSPYWFPDNWRFNGVPLMQQRVSPNNNANNSHGFNGTIPLYILGSGFIGVPGFEGGTFGVGGSSRQVTNGMTISLNPEYDPTGLLNFYAELL